MEQGGFVPSEAIVSNGVRQMMERVVDFSLISIICYLGVVGNSLTLYVFRKQGYKETINISLTAIAIWDLIKCICGAIYRLCGPIQVISPQLELTYNAIAALAFAFPSFFCTYVSSVLAAYVSIERCLCVSLPLMVKFILTPKVVTSVMAVLSAISFGSFLVLFSVFSVVWEYHEGYNATIAIMTYKTVPFHPEVLQYYHVIGFLWPVLSLVIQCVCTWVISYHLRKASKFRSDSSMSVATATVTADKGDNSSNSKQPVTMSSRDKQVTKMLLVVILVYIINLFPRVIVSVVKTIVPEFYMYRYYHNLFASCMWMEHLFDFLNASVNPLIYYFMSSQYKATFLEMFCQRKKS